MLKAEETASIVDNSEIAIILVNWNGWQDTIECLESIFKNECKNFLAIVCDNASTDKSWGKIISWAHGSEVSQPASDEMATYSQPPSPKPLPIKMIDHQGNASGDENARLILIQTGANLGFAGGNNVGMQYVLDHCRCKFFWLLNNDTVIKQDAVDHLINHMKTSQNVGMCGTRIHFYHQPDVIQALGGATYNTWTGNSKCIGSYRPIDTIISDNEVIYNSDFVIGASMCLTRDFLDKIGLMEESYFLYYEEIDWAQRAKGMFEFGYASDVTVFHKEGGSIGSSSIKGERSLMSEYYLMRSKIIFTSKFFPMKLITIYLYGIVQIFIRVLRGKNNLSKAITYAMIGRNLQKNQRSRTKNE